MPLRLYRCPVCGHEQRRMDRSGESKLAPLCEVCNAQNETEVRTERVIGSPQAKFMEKVDQAKNKSNLKGQQKMLLERSRVHTRDSEAADELIQTNEVEVAEKNAWLVRDSSGNLRKRKGIDDL